MQLVGSTLPYVFNEYVMSICAHTLHSISRNWKNWIQLKLASYICEYYVLIVSWYLANGNLIFKYAYYTSMLVEAVGCTVISKGNDSEMRILSQIAGQK